MSSQYTAEPPTEGVVTLQTTHGDLTICLWPNDAPNATRLFVSNVLAGAFQNTPFHRIVPDLLVQAGTAPSFKGLNSKPIPVELNNRLRFCGRILVAIVSDGDDEGSRGREYNAGGAHASGENNYNGARLASAAVVAVQSVPK